MELQLRNSIKEYRMRLYPHQRKTKINFTWQFPYNAENRLASFLENEARKYLQPLVNRLSKYKYKKDSEEDEINAYLEFFERKAFSDFNDEKMFDKKVLLFLLLLLSDIKNHQMDQFIKFYNRFNGGKTPPFAFNFDYPSRIAIKDVSRELENAIVTLIRSIKSDFSLLVTGGMKYSKFLTTIAKRFTSTVVGKMKFIARNAVGNFTAYVNKSIAGLTGNDYYYWVTVGDEKVREIHKTLNGKICRWSDSTVYSDDGITWLPREDTMVKLHPAEDYNCRCSGIPFIEKDLREIDKEISNG
jgi:SPP1 gp7 family putative phage head morphogenesis protein